MSTNWDHSAEQYLELAGPPGTFRHGPELHSRNVAIRDLLGRAASALPKDKSAALSWFTSTLQRDPQR